MTKTAFNSLIRRLEKYYGTEQTDDWAIKEYYNAALCVLDKHASTFYANLLKAYKFFPRVSEFRETAELHRDKQNKIVYTNPEFCYCCMDTGIIRYIKKGLQPFPNCEYEFAARCFCNAGKNKPDWPYCTEKVTQEELDLLAKKNRDKYGNITPAQSQKAKNYVTAFIKGFA